MTPTPFNLIRTVIRLFTAVLLFILIIPLRASADAYKPILADPPRAPERPLGMPSTQAISVAASCTAGYTCNYLPMLLKAAVDPRDRQYALNLYKQNYLGSAGVDIGWTGNIAGCDAGTTNSAFRSSVLQRINYFREMAGVPKVRDLRSDYNQQDQAAALMMAANHTLNHTPPNSWACFSQTGYDGSSSSNLAMGAYGPDAISLYMDDGVGSLGHRRWVLYPQTQEMGTGDIAGSGGWQTWTNAMKSWDAHVWDPRPATRDEFVAWPPAAYVPYQVVYQSWSFAVQGADFSAAAVNVTLNGAPITVNIYQTDNGYGENTLAWTGDWPTPTTDNVYRVSVQNVKANGSYRNYTYTVTVFNPDR